MRARRTRRRWPITWARPWRGSSTTAGPATSGPSDGRRPRRKNGRTTPSASGSRRCGPSSRRPASPRASRRGSRRSPARTATATASPTCSSCVTGHFPGEADDRPAAAELARGRAAIAALERARSGYPWNPFERVEPPAGPDRRESGTTAIRNPIDAFIAAEHAARGLTPRPEASRPVLLRRLYSRPDRPAAHARRAARLPRRRRAPTLTRRSSIACWPARDTASAGGGTGWTSGGTATGPAGASRSATASRISGTGATGSSSRSTATSRTTAWSSRCSRPTRKPRGPRRPPRHRLPRAELQAAQPREVDAGRGRPHRPGLPGRDARLRPLPRPHVRPDPPEGVLPGPRDLRAAPGPDRPGPRRARHQARTASPAPIDAQLDVKTLLFIRGDDRYPTGKPLPPGRPRIAGRPDSRSSRWRCPSTAIAPGPAQGRDLRRARRAQRGARRGRGRAWRRPSGRRRTPTRSSWRGATSPWPGPSSTPGSRSSGPRRWPSEAGRDRRSGPRRPTAATAAQRHPGRRAGAAGPRSWRARRVERPPREAGRGRQGPAPTRSRPWSVAREAAGQPASTSLHPAAADDLSGHQHGTSAGVRPLDRRRVEPADRPGGRQPHLGPPLRPRDRADGQRLRPQRPAADRTPRCSTGWPPS